MASSLFCLGLLFFISVGTSAQSDSDLSSIRTGCQNTLPTVDNADVSEEYVKSNYTKGDKLLYNCQKGYVSHVKITFLCDGHRWTLLRNAECSRKRCELPNDIPNGRYIIINGTNFVYGTTIKYICNEGYQMASRTDTRTCLALGWDNHLPLCEELSCSPPITKENLIVHGLPDEDELIRYGHRLQFSCSGPGLKVVGPSEIMCETNGNWTYPSPRCEEVTCELESIDPRLSVIGLPETNISIKYGHKLQFYCSDQNFLLEGNEEVKCSTGGLWSSPFPTCKEAVCKEGQLNYVKIVRGNPSVRPPFKPGHALMFQCAYSFMIMKGESVITCRRDGTWNRPYPTCYSTSACPAPIIDPLAELKLRRDLYEHNAKVRYECPLLHVTQGEPLLTCFKGKWIGHAKCYKPCILTIEDMDARQIQQYHVIKQPMYSKHNDYITFKCQGWRTLRPGSPNLRQMCNDGNMPLPFCQ